jgi:hypothetical protein
MATFKTEIQNRRADGTYQVRIRVTHNRVVRRISTPLFVTSAELTRGLKIKNTFIIEKCNALISKCRDACNNMDNIKALPADKLTDKLKAHLQGGERFSLDFIGYMRSKAVGMSYSKIG